MNNKYIHETIIEIKKYYSINKLYFFNVYILSIKN